MGVAEKALVTLMRLIAAMGSLAIVPVFMPHAWMDATHRWLGMGELPETPVIVYLTRSLSALYAFQAGLLWLVSCDVRRYGVLVTYVSAAFAVFGAIVLWIDLKAGTPWFWTLGEGPFLIVMGLAMLVLQRRMLSASPVAGG